MSMDLYLTNDKTPNYANKEYTLDDINYLNKRLSYLEKIIQSKYSDILYLASEICNLKNVNLKYDLIDILIKHGSNLSKYKSELADVKDIINSFNNNFQKSQEHQQFIEKDQNINNDIENTQPHNFEHNNKDFENHSSNTQETNQKIDINEFTDNESKNIDINLEKNKKSSLTKNVNLKNLKVVDNASSEQKNKAELAREKILTNLDKLITYKENTFNDLIEMVDFHIDSNSQKIDLSKFIESLESQIVELNEYKNNILKNYSLSKSIELGSNGKITFSRIFIEKERLIDKNKEEYIRVLTEMHELYSEFVDNYLRNINSMKPHLNPEKINLMQNNCGKVIYDLKLIKNLCSSLDKIKSV